MSGELRRIGRATDIPPLEGRRVTVDGLPVAVFRTEEGFRAIGGACPHKGGPLADGLVADRCVTCPLHGWRFDLLTGERIGGAGPALATYDVREREGVLELRVAAAEPLAA